MSDNLICVKHLLDDKLSVPVYTGEIPEYQTGPAVLLTNVANPFTGRSLSGKKYGKSNVYRVTIVAESIVDVESVINELDDMDNSQNTDFQRIYTNLVQTEFGLTESPYKRAFVDLTVYKR